MKFVYLLPLLIFFIVTPAFAYNSGFRPVYQPAIPPGAGGPIENYCVIGDFLHTYNSTTKMFTCATPSGSGGENNTASSSGLGYSLVLPKSGVDLPFKGLWATGDLSISQNATDITFSHTASANSNLRVNTQTSTNGIFVTGINNVTGGITIQTFKINNSTCTGNQFLKQINNLTGQTVCSDPAGFTDTNTAQIASAGGTSLFKQRDNATQNTLKGLTTVSGITLTPNTNDVQIDTNFKIDTLSTIAIDNFISAFNNATGDWTLKTFSVNSKTCSGTDKISSIDNATGNVICSTDTGGTDTNTAQIVSAGGTTLFKQRDNATQNTIKGLTTTYGITLTANTNDVNITPNFKVNTKTPATRQILTSYDNSTSSGLFSSMTFGINSITCGANQFVNLITNSSGLTTCATPTGSTDTNTAQIVSAGGTTLFKARNNATENAIKGLTTVRGLSLTANTNDVQVDTNFKVNTKSSATRQFLTSFNNATTDGSFASMIFGINSITCGANQFVNLITNSSGLTQCGTPTGSGITSINSAPATTAKLIQSNSTTKATFKTLTQGTGITLTNGSSAVTIATDHKVNTLVAVSKKFVTSFNNATSNGNFGTTTFAINNQTTNGDDRFLTGINNQTGVISTKVFSVNTQSCSVGTMISSIDNSTGNVICTTVTASGGATSLVANVTNTSAPSTDSLVFTIPLTTSSGNAIQGVIVAKSSISGTAVRLATNVTAVGTNGARGACHSQYSATTTTDAVANVILNTVLTGRAPNNVSTLWIPVANTPQNINFECAVIVGTTATNLKIWITPEVTGATISANAGSHYIKTP